MVKIVTLFLIALMVLGMFGKFRPRDWLSRRPRARAAAKCAACGRPRLGRGPCPCGKG